MGPLSVRLGAALIYLFVAALTYLAGIYVAPLFYTLYLLLLFVPLLSFIQLTVTLIGLRYFQDFDTEHPVKGQGIGYRLTVANETFLASCLVKIRFKSVHPDLSTSLQDISVAFRGRSSLQKSYRISCPYRGIYTVGLETLETHDLLGWLRVTRPVYHRTFYVYPRIIDLEPSFGGARSYGLQRVSRAGRESDYALIEGLDEYRPGLPVRHIAWKKFFETGKPFLKSFGKSAQPGITLYIDLRREAPPETAELEAEDCSIEIAVALVKYFLDNRVPVTVKAMGGQLYLFRGNEPEDFDSFYRDTINLLFQRTISPASVFQSDTRRSGVEGSVLFITHLLDPEILELLDIGGAVGAIINLRSMSEEERKTLQAHYERLSDAALKLFVVSGPETIREDLT